MSADNDALDAARELRAENDRLRAQLEASRAQVDTMLRENDDLREQLASVDTCVSDDAVALRVAVEENARLLAERDRLRAVLADTPENLEAHAKATYAAAPVRLPGSSIRRWEDIDPLYRLAGICDARWQLASIRARAEMEKP